MQPSTSGGQKGSGDFDLTQFYQVFFEEAGENLEQMESLLLELDVGAPDDEQLNAIFRCAHSIKGGAATFGFQDLASLTHVMETLLDRLRRHEISLESEMVDVLLESGDALRALLARHQGTTTDVMDCGPLTTRIGAMADPGKRLPVATGGPALPSVRTGEASPMQPKAEDRAVVASRAQPTGSTASSERVCRLGVGPGVGAPTIGDLLALFDEIAGLGRCTPLPQESDPAKGMHCFRLETGSTNDDLIDLLAFHVDRKLITIDPFEVPEGLQDAPDGSYGFFVDIEPGPAKVVTTIAPAIASAQAGIGTPAAPRADSIPAEPDPAGVEAAGQTRANVAVAARAPAKGEKASADAGTIRVSVDKVDQLINLVGELVITQAMLDQTGQALDPAKHQQLIGSLADLERSTRLMQEAVMAIRMIPMAVVFNRFPRMLRDLAARLGKKIDFQTRGEATELDKSMIEKITDPLTHLVRNAVDHGIETPEARKAQGKSEVGTLVLSAEHRGGSIVIEVRDDGKGLSREKLLSKARERGMNAHDGMTDAEVWNLIFEPGFSTADVVSDVSGRGVGMDVVRRNIQSLGGSVEIDSALGFGTRVSVRLPLTLAIMDGMSVGVGRETYIVPLGSVIESIQLDEASLRAVAGIDRLIRVRDEYLPLISLAELFDVRDAGFADDDARASEPAIVLVVEAEGMRCAVRVDRLIGQHQIVVKSLEANYRRVDGIAGATILGDGHVALILDIGWLVRRVRH